MEFKKRLLKHSIAVAVIAVLGIIIELFVFNNSAFMHKNYKVTYYKKDGNNNGFADRKLGDNRAAVVVMDSAYIKKMKIEFDSNADFNYKVKMVVRNRFNKKNDKTVEDKYYNCLAAANLNIGSSVEKIKVIYPSNVTVRSITIENNVKFNFIRLFFVFFSLGLIYTIIVCRRLVTGRIEYVFLMMALCMGGIMVAALPESFRSWDEQIHFNRAYMYSYGETVKYSEAAWRLKNLDVPEVNNVEDRIAVRELLDEEEKEGNIVKEAVKDNNFITYAGRAYLPQTFALWLARMTNMDFTSGLMLARYLNLAQYIFWMFLAIKSAKHGKRILTIIGLLPTSLFIAASFSYDAYVTGLVTFGFVMIINEFTDADEKVNWKRILAGVCGVTIGSFAKAVYIPLLLFLCFLPDKKFIDKKQKWMFRSSVIIIFLVMMSTFVLPAITNAASGTESGGDKRGGDTSVTRQLNSVISHPVEYTELLMDSVITTAPEYFLGRNSRTFFAYLGGDKAVLYYLSLIVTLFVAFTEGAMEHHLPIARHLKIALACVVFCVIALIWTALYLDFTAVGLNKINGVQPRYYIPLMFPVVLLIENARIKSERISEFRYNQLVLMSCFIVLAGMIYEYILVPCCL